jgi:hypothetical protein
LLEYSFCWHFSVIFFEEGHIFRHIQGHSTTNIKSVGINKQLWKQDTFLYALVSFHHLQTKKIFDIQSQLICYEENYLDGGQLHQFAKEGYW